MFAGINLSDWLSGAYVSALRLFGMAAANVADASDLVALPMVLASVAYAHRATARQTLSVALR